MQPQVHAMQQQLMPVVPEGLRKLLLAGDLPGQPELTADLAGRLKEGDGMAPGGGR